MTQGQATPGRGRVRHRILPLTGLAASVFCSLFSISYNAFAEAPQAAAPAPSPYSYADIADLAAQAPMVAVVRIRGIAVIPPARSGPVPAGMIRNYVEADVLSLIRGETEIARRIGFVMDLPADRGAAKAIKRKTFVIFGRSGAQADQVQLVSSSALLPQTPATEAKVRAIVTELLSAAAPPVIAGVGEAFHVAGTVAGEGETQIFLTTDSGRPVSLSIIRRPDMASHFGVALGEIVDESAAIPARDTLLWYRLACMLPATLPDGAVAKLEADDAAAARRDYTAFMEQLGSCTRTRPAPFAPPRLAMIVHPAKSRPRADPGAEMRT